MIEADRQRKIHHESRLRWQSHLMLGVVLLLCAIGLGTRLSPGLTPASVEGLAICAGFGLLVWLVRAATPFAGLTGFLLTSCLYVASVDQPNGGWFHTALLPGLALFALAFAATRFRRAQKEQVGLAESRRGRGASQVAANMGVAAIAALALPRFSIFFSPLIAALAEAAADTVSSEIGQAMGGRPVLLSTLRSVPAGTDGAVSLAGTAAGAIAAAMVVLAAIPTLRIDPEQAVIAWVAAILGLFADSLIGATLERRGWLNNDSVNFISTALAASIALVTLLKLQP